MKAAAVIVGFANTVLGQKEKPGNSGFVSPWIEKKMIEMGFVKGDAWCTLAVKLILFEAYQGTIFEDYIERLCSKSAVETWKNFRKEGPFPCNCIPVPGAAVFWQYYKDGKKTWQGHAGIVTEVTPKMKSFFWTVEGNGNSEGGREGIEFAYRKRDFSLPVTGLRLLGFIHPANLDL